MEPILLMNKLINKRLNAIEGEIIPPESKPKGFCDVCGLAFQDLDPLGLSNNRKLKHRDCEG